MFIYTHHECPHCGSDIEVEIEVNETDGDLPDDCPFCGKSLGHPDLTADAMGNAVDRAMDAAKGN